MSVSNRFILHQLPVIRAFGLTALTAARRRLTTKTAVASPLPGPWLEQRIAPRDPEMVKAYVRHVGGDPRAYRHALPGHLFPQWGFALATQALAEVDYPLHKALNAGCRLEQNHPLPNDEALLVRARVESVDDNGRRALICQQIVTGTKTHPDALVARMYALVPLAKGESQNTGDSPPPQKKKNKVRAPDDAREVAYWKLRASDGLSFAKLTGDFNPVHWVPAYARAFGFRNTILHGFATMARAIESLKRNVYCADASQLDRIDVQFTSPLVLPARVGLYLKNQTIHVADGPGGRAYLKGSFGDSSTKTTEESETNSS